MGITPCYHMYCYSCLHNSININNTCNNMCKNSYSKSKCPKCRALISKDNIYKLTNNTTKLNELMDIHQDNNDFLITNLGNKVVYILNSIYNNTFSRCVVIISHFANILQFF